MFFIHPKIYAPFYDLSSISFTFFCFYLANPLRLMMEQLSFGEIFSHAILSYLACANPTVPDHW